MDMNGKSDPYVVVKIVGSSSKNTKVIKKTLDPTWNETLKIDLKPEDKHKRLFVECWDQDTLSADDFMGRMSFGISANMTKDGWFKFLTEKEGELFNVPVSDEEWTQKVEEMSISPNNENRNGIGTSDFDFLLTLGKGSFGLVALAEYKETGQLYAIKMLRKDIVVKDGDVACTLIEKNVLAMPNKSPFLTQMHSCFQTVDRLFFVMELVSGGDLLNRIMKVGRFKEPTAVFYAAEIALGLMFLHSNGVIYRDLKLENVLLDQDGHIKIADFGMCKEDIRDGATARTFCGTPDYIAPEIVQFQPYNKSVDWWSFGVLVYEMLVGHPPFDGNDEDELFEAILTQTIDFPNAVSKEAKELVKGFLTRNPIKRLGCGPNGDQDILESEFFQTIDWAQLEARDIEPPFQPQNKNPKKAENFDKQFKRMPVDLKPITNDIINQLKNSEDQFPDFDFVNPEFVDA